MDFYPTRYSELSNSEINELYCSNTWSVLSSEERLDALQELENRVAGELGNQPCEVHVEKMNGAMYGYYKNGQIAVNESLVNDGILQFEDEKGNIQKYTPSDINAQMMDTIHHENYHAYQDNVIEKRLEHDNQIETNLWCANEDMYISSLDNNILYRIQSLERTAFERGESQTKAAFEESQAIHGEDVGYQEYLVSINKYSYENTLIQAKEVYGDENIQETLDQHMLTTYQANYVENSLSIDAASSSDMESDNEITEVDVQNVSSTEETSISDSNSDAI